MLDFFYNLFDTSDFPARWRSGSWTSGHGWLHIVSDLSISAAFTVIPLLTLLFVWRRKEVQFLPLFYLFGTFIFLCGTVHLIESIAFWHPLYRVSGLLKAATAIASWVSVVAVVLALPKAVRLPRLELVNADLERANRELDEFAKIVSHDLKAPLRAIASVVKWIAEEGWESRESFQENVALLVERTQRMENLINGILKYSRVGRRELDFEEIDTGAMVKGIVGSLEIPERIEIRIETNMPTVRYDRVMLTQVFQNLISNAVENDEKTSALVEIGFTSDRDDWIFNVCDNGGGIPREDFERIFFVFQTAGPRDGKVSTGIGLSIVRKIVTTMGGDIRVKSDMGKGTCFSFTVPKHKSARNRRGVLGWLIHDRRTAESY